jgi:lysophospholipase L1-like esterase
VFPEELFSFRVYALNTALAAILSLLGMATAFRWFRKGRSKRTIDLLVFGSTVLFLTSALDAWVLFFRVDTYGMGSRWSLTSRNWQEQYVRLNPQGYWDRDFAPYGNRASGDKTVILAVGDSYTYGQGVKGARHRFTDRLERRLREELGADVDVLNVGRQGANTVSETQAVRTLGPSIKPDIVMVFYLANDITELEVFKREPPRPHRVVQALLTLSPSFNYLYWTWIGPRLYERQGAARAANILFAYLDGVAMQKHLGEIRELIDSVRALNATPVFVITPYPRLWDAVNPSWQSGIYRRITDEVEAMGVEVISLQPIEQQLSLAEFSVGRMDAHPSERAHALIADELFQWFRRGRLIRASKHP